MDFERSARRSPSLRYSQLRRGQMQIPGRGSAGYSVHRLVPGLECILMDTHDLGHVWRVPARKHPCDGDARLTGKLKDRTVAREEILMVQLKRRIRVFAVWVSTGLVKEDVGL